MGNLPCRFREKDEDAWKQQNREMEANPAYSFADLAKGGKLIDAYNNEGPRKVEEIARNEMSKFLYHPNGDKHPISLDEFLVWQWKLTQRIKGLDDTEKVSIEKLKADYVEDYFNKFVPHDACWDIRKRGGVGETPFHLLYLMDAPVHFEVARIVLDMYPHLALDIYEGEEYFGESALHIAIVIGDMESMQHLVESGADVHQRATGRFFLPEDQKNGFTNGTNYDGYAYYGEYPLAFAACLGHIDMYDYLLDHGANPDLQDSFGNTVLHMVVIADQAEMYKYAVRHHKRPANTGIKNYQNLTPLTLACKLGRHAIFKEMLDLDSIEFWRFSTTMCSAHPLRTLDSVGPDGSTNWNSALMIIVNGDKDDHLEMLEGGVMRQLLDEKWKTFAKRRFIVRLILAIIHLSLLSVAIYTRPSSHDHLAYRGTLDIVRYVAEIIVCVSCVLTVVYEVKEISTQGFSSFFKNCTHAPAQTVYLISCLLIIACVPFRFIGLYEVEDILLIIAAPCSWFFLLFFARGFPETGPNIVMMYMMVQNDMLRFSIIYSTFILSFMRHKLTGPFVTMIYKMCAGDLLPFATIYVICLVGFTQGFFFLFRDVDLEGSFNRGEVSKFATIPETILYLFQMTLGEFKYEIFNYSHYSVLTKIIFALFMILVPILLLNMLIAMMGNTYATVISKSGKEWRKQWAKIVVVLERGISQKKLLEHQRSYSVRLSGGPPNADGSPGPPEERALVVIKSCSKSRAKTRKQAVYRWKMLGKEVIHQLRVKKVSGTGKPFELTESMRKTGNSLSALAAAAGEGGLDHFSSTVAQLAWEKDIDLTKGHQFVTDPDSISPRSPNTAPPPPQAPSPSNHVLPPPQASIANGSVIKHKTAHVQSEKVNDIAMTQMKKKRNLAYNRVSPLLNLLPMREETTFTDLSDDNGPKEAESEVVFHFPTPRPEETPSSQHQSPSTIYGSPTHQMVASEEPNPPIVQSEFSLSADSSSASEVKPEVTFPRMKQKRGKFTGDKDPHQSDREERDQTPDRKEEEQFKNEVEVMSSTSSLRYAEACSAVSSSNDIEVRDIESAQDSTHATASVTSVLVEATPSASCWTEDSPTTVISPKKTRKRDLAKKGKFKGKTKGAAGGGDSSSSLITLVESTGSKDDAV